MAVKAALKPNKIWNRIDLELIYILMIKIIHHLLLGLQFEQPIVVVCLAALLY